VIADPPVDAGGVQFAMAVTVPAATVPPARPCLAVPMTGLPGSVGVVIDAEGAEFGLAFTALTARTTNVYVVPFTRFVTTWLVAVPVTVSVLTTLAPTRTSICEPVMGEPPSLAGAVQLTVACESPALAVAPVGDPGTVYGVTAFEAVEEVLDPSEFVAWTVNV